LFDPDTEFSKHWEFYNELFPTSKKRKIDVQHTQVGEMDEISSHILQNAWDSGCLEQDNLTIVAMLAGCMIEDVKNWMQSVCSTN
jgi:hypothetical protein